MAGFARRSPRQVREGSAFRGRRSRLDARAPSHSQPMHRKPIRNGMVLARAARSVRVLREAHGARDVPGRLEVGACGELGLVLGGALLDVRLHEQLAAVDEEARDRLDEPSAHDEALGVTLLPPRIGEVNEHRAHRRIRREPLERLACIGVEHARAPAEAGLGQAFIDEGGPFEANFEADEAGVGCGNGALEEKPAAPGADLELHWTAARQQHGELDGALVRQAWSAGVRVAGANSEGHGRGVRREERGAF